MKILLIKDVYKLGHAGDVKKVADGYGRNYLIPQGLAVMATPGALKQADRIRSEAAKQRAILNQEMSGVVQQLEDVVLMFPARAGETDKLYGSVTTRMIAEKVREDIGLDIDHRQVDTQPLRMLGEHTVSVRLTVDLVPEIKVVVYREGETPTVATEELESEAIVAEDAEGAPEDIPVDEVAPEITPEDEGALEDVPEEAEVSPEDTIGAETEAVLEDAAEAEAKTEVVANVEAADKVEEAVETGDPQVIETEAEVEAETEADPDTELTTEAGEAEPES